MKDREATLEDNQAITKIKAFIIAKKEQDVKRKRLFKELGGSR